MKTMIATALVALQLAMPAGLVPTGAMAQEASDCLTGREAQQAVEAGEILELPVAARREGLALKFIGDEAQLCNVDGAPHWVVNVMSSAGHSERIVLNAQAN